MKQEYTPKTINKGVSFILHGLIKDEKGSMTVESAIIIPLFILFILLCILYLSYYFSFVDKQTINISSIQKSERDPAEVRRVTDFICEILEEINDRA